MKIKAFLIISFFAIACNGDEEKAMEPMKTVPFVDIKLFMGDWFVIANIPTFIEKDATNAIESYKLNEKGEIETTFTFYQNSPNGLKKEYRPKGFIYNSKTNAEWRMQFIWPFKSPFLIIDLADDYSYTVIGVPNRKYVWIMAREPQLSDEIFSIITQKLAGIGYDISKIQKILQEWK
jgi:apolipoprotein D and lipocalin family protein